MQRVVQDTLVMKEPSSIGISGMFRCNSYFFLIIIYNILNSPSMNSNERWCGVLVIEVWILVRMALLFDNTGDERCR